MSSESLLETLQHLSQAAKLVDGDNRTKKLLHSYYLSRIQRLAAAGNVTVESSSHSSCSKCRTSFNDSKNFSMSIKPRRIRKEKYKKLVNKFDCKSQEKLSRLKRNIGKKYAKLLHNVAEITCKLCNSKSKSNIHFEEKAKPKPIEPPIVQLSELELVKPKKRKRDKHAGLKVSDKVFAATSAVVAQPKIESKPVIHPKPIIHPTKVLQSKSKGNNGKKSKNSSTEKKMKNMSSAQKQRKDILLLANALKMSDQRQQDSSQMKLHKLFK